MKTLVRVKRPETAMILSSLRKNKFGLVGLVVVLIFTFVAIFSSVIAPYDPTEVHLSERFLLPNREFLLGTDEFGRDVLSRLIYGAQVSFVIAVGTVAISMLLGVLIGSISGYYRGKVDFVVMRVVDIFNSFPYLLLAIGIIAVLGRGIDRLILALPILFWTDYARITRGISLYLGKLEFVQASRIFGSSNFRTIVSHILPNVFPSCIVVATFQLGSAIITETSLSFLGLGVNPPMASWGNMLTNSREYILKAPQLAIIPGLVITAVILGFNLLGDALRDALDPRLKL
jgi:peptide/nickel transport system permease protein